jgi:recombination protein RecA
MPRKSSPGAEKNERVRAAQLAVEQIRERFGEGSIMRLGEAQRIKVEVIPTGIPSLDLALGVGGIPRGRITEIYGPEAGGKTTCALHIVAQAQRQGGVAAYVDAEHALDPNYARKIGVRINDLLVSQPDTGEQALDIVETLVRSGAVDVIVVDSVAALTPRAEIEGEMGDQHVGLQARLMSQALRKITGAVAKANTAVIFINQIRMNIGVMFGNPEVTTGGRALKFYASVRIELRRRAQIKQGERTIGNRVVAKVVKNKVAPPFLATEFDIIYSEGVSIPGDILDLGVRFGLVEKSGTWFTYGEHRLGQGREAAKEALRQQPKLAREIIAATLKAAHQTAEPAGQLTT